MNKFLRVNKKNFIIALVGIVMLFGENVILSTINSKDNFGQWNLCVSLIVFFNICCMIFIFVKQEVRVLSLAGFFIILSYIFHFGQVIINGFFPNYQYTLLNAVGKYKESVVRGELYALNIIVIVTIFIIASSNRECEINCYNRFSELDLRDVRRISWRILSVTMPIQLFVIIKELVQAQTIVYGNGSESNGMLFQIGSLSIIGFVLLLFGNSENKNRLRAILFLEVVWYIISMFSGSRIYAVISILILLYCYLSLEKKIRVWKFVLYLILAIFFMGLLNSIMHVRSVGIISFSAILKDLLNFDSNFILGTLEEFGGSVYTVTNGFDEIPKNVPFNYGKSYIESFALVGVNVRGILTPIMDNIAFTTRFVNQYSYGGSYIGELYYNFGYFSYFVAPLIGIVVGKVSNMLNYCVRNQYYIKGSFYIMIFYGFILWIRGYANALPRGIVWGAVLIVITYKTTSKCIKANEEN